MFQGNNPPESKFEAVGKATVFSQNVPNTVVLGGLC